ncbi:ABC transporter ATP-binding protein [Polycladidibacter hongkongensis]|uniref:ABC transporter ATP-binding protein n=1 Tax=Polycladidibacter hongkongensis TaxID=1647556 RepID=UPI00082B4C5D|nr:ABC transporter ATP-binding protein [Pseudovibrio hongkongensis]
MFRLFEKLVDPFEITELQTPPEGLWQFIWFYARPFRWLLLCTAVLAGGIAILEVWLFSFMGELVNWLEAGNRETIWQDSSLMLVGMGLVVLVVMPLVSMLWEFVFHQGIVGNFPMLIRWRGHRYLLRQSMDFFNNDFAGRLSNKLMQSAIAVREVVTKLTDIGVYVCVYFATAIAVLAATDIWLALPMFTWMFGYVAVMWFFVPKLRDVAKQQADARSVMTGHVVDAYTNISTVKLFSQAQDEEAYAQGSMEKFMDPVYRQMRLVTWLNIVLTSLNCLLFASLTVTAIYLWQVDLVTTGSIAVAIGLALRFQGMSQWILWEVASLFENIGTVQDGISMLCKPVKVQDAKSATDLVVSDARIDFDNVRFHYGKESGVLEQLSLSVQKGEKIGIVGRSGAGKSTLMNLLLRFHDLEGGQIRIDGQDIAMVRQESLRSQIGVVTQDTSLLHRTVFENIAYGSGEVAMEQVQEAARRAHALEFIEGLRDPKGRTGFETLVGERGVKLSGGQRQRIAIARVLLRNAPILVLDEATSALDSEVEAAIQESLFELMEGKTVIAIAHRLSTIAAMDRLVVMDKGEIKEMGSHEDLLAANGLYASLWQRQSGGFLAQAAAE